MMQTWRLFCRSDNDDFWAQKERFDCKNSRKRGKKKGTKANKEKKADKVKMAERLDNGEKMDRALKAEDTGYAAQDYVKSQK